ncbi:hypothetical protein AXG93_392s1020 [Marchantia polymorpha subsp. ruderalis]|uniref:Uncharacterized protein n=1 Tax=Marchantia polymorpha subsp. ruderalis TaxID=1480154 RepID=A0A176WSH9_MARPO|nr:hypothetical protein AXG93_392s1020 [Marchantia polymorpha subsp. ruderalis]
MQQLWIHFTFQSPDRDNDALFRAIGVESTSFICDNSRIEIVVLRDQPREVGSRVTTLGHGLALNQRSSDRSGPSFSTAAGDCTSLMEQICLNRPSGRVSLSVHPKPAFRGVSQHEIGGQDDIQARKAFVYLDAREERRDASWRLTLASTFTGLRG